jgi:hypothetical protein
LIELIVAITAGMFVAIAAFALARQGSRFFQQEARVAGAQFAATAGFERLRNDIARAAFLSTPNVQNDPRRCGPTNTWPDRVKSLAALRIEQAKPAVAQDKVNGLAPDRIEIAGSFTTAESFPVREVIPSGSVFNVYLQTAVGPMVRATQGQLDGGSLDGIFKTNRILRLLDAAGRYEYGVISNFKVDSAGTPVITLKQEPAITFKRGGGVCGVEGLGIGMQANVINWVRYELRDLAADPGGYKPIFDKSAAPGEEGRLELVRVELDADGNEMDGTLELVAEYAVDLKFGLTVVSGFPNGPSDPDLKRVEYGDSAIAGTWAGDVSKNPGVPGPERIRSVRARLVVRSREADRAETIAAPAGNIYRYQLGPDGGFARTRTITADIQLPNLAGVQW